MTDGGGALILVAAERSRDFPQSLPLAVNRGPVYLLGTGESVEPPMVSQMEDFTSSRAFRVAGPKAFAEAGITHNDVDHLMIYDAPVRCQGQALRICQSTASRSGFVPRGEAGAFIAKRNTRPRPHPRRQDLGLPRRRRYVRRLRHDHHVERGAVSGAYQLLARDVLLPDGAKRSLFWRSVKQVTLETPPPRY